MPYFRIQYQGYIEGEYNSKEQVVEHFIECAMDDLEDGNNLVIETFNEESQQWENA